MMNHLLHLDRSADVDGFLAFVELLFHSIIWPKPVASGLGGRATPASVLDLWVTGTDIVSIKGWQGTIRGTETENEGGWDTRTEETVEFRDFLPPAPTVFFWSTTMQHGLYRIRRATVKGRRKRVRGEEGYGWFIVIRDINK